MAYAVLVSLAQTIDEILNHDQLSISLLERQKMISIYDYVIFLQNFLEYFPEKVNADFEDKIMDVSTEAEDVTERFMLKQFESSYGQWRRYHDLDELKRVDQKFDSIASEAMNIRKSFRNEDIRTTVDSPAAGSATLSSPSSRLAPSHKKEAMVGFDNDLLAIKERLRGESSKLQVIPIVGMGGIGKTTLATNAYLDPLTMEYFDIRAWVTVSQDFSAEEVFSELLSSMKELKTCRSDQYEEKLYKILKCRRYLIVMDDIWSTKAWDDVRRIFPDDNNGSRIMLTTRLSHVAAYADSSSRIHEMHLMDAEQSWALLRRKVFRYEEECPLALIDVGKEIARRCGGLPLAIVVIAGLLSTSITPASWQEIADNIKSAISSTKDGQIEKILSLSYTHLPRYLRPCFLYMGAFPEDYTINVSKLIMLWAAESFLEIPNGSKSYEEVANEYLEDLVRRSLVFVTRMKSNGKIKSCRVHDLVRDLCVRKAKEVRLLNLVDTSFGEIDLQSIKYQRRICIIRSDLVLPAYVSSSAEILRTIISFRSRPSSLGHLENFKLLRILNMVYSSDISLPVEVFKLYRLKYLAFCSSKEIPAYISNLQNLQTLIINPPKTFYLGYSRPRLVYLPKEIWKMRQLRHLVSSLSVLLPFLGEDTGACGLENLVTLTISVDIMASTAGMFKMIPNLKKLKISYYEGIFDNEYHLNELARLEKLTLIQHVPLTEKVKPAFAKTLRKLTLKGRLPWDEDMMRNVGSLPNLQVLKLRDPWFRGKKWKTREGEFTQLKFLLIENSLMNQWITESSHFPTLNCLLLHHCWDLIEIPDSIGEIQTLELIEIKGYKRSLVESAKRILKEQQDFGNDAFQLRCVDFEWLVSRLKTAGSL